MKYLFSILLMLITLSACKNQQVIANDYFRKYENKAELSTICQLNFPTTTKYIKGDPIIDIRIDTIKSEVLRTVTVEVDCPISDKQTTVKKDVTVSDKKETINNNTSSKQTDTIYFDDPSKREVINNQLNIATADNFKLKKEKEISDEQLQKQKKQNLYLWIGLISIIVLFVLYKILKSKFSKWPNIT